MRLKNATYALSLLGALVVLPFQAMAQDPPAAPGVPEPIAAAAAAATTAVAASPLSAGDTAWMLASTALVLMMTVPGVALFYGGMVRKQNVLAMVMQSFAITCLVTVLWAIVGYSLAFRGEDPFIGGLDRLLLKDIWGSQHALAGTIPETVFMTFQMTFAIITPALITGAFADRVKFSALLWFMGLWLILVYCPIAHMVWSPKGLAAQWGVLDFAGGTVVHINAGIAGLVFVLVVGKRKGYVPGGSHALAPHNLVLSLIGASLLWVGWFGFNAGSAVSAGERAGMAMAVTQIATGTAGLSWMFTEWLSKGKPSVLGIISGAVAGLVAITPASGFVGPNGALAIGVAAGVLCYLASTTVKKALGYDDALDVFGVHGVGGIIGALLTGVFAVAAISTTTDATGATVAGTAGLLEGNAGQVWIQLKGVLLTLVYTGVVTFVILKLLQFTIGLRVSEEAERDGLDLALHGEAVQ